MNLTHEHIVDESFKHNALLIEVHKLNFNQLKPIFSELIGKAETSNNPLRLYVSITEKSIDTKLVTNILLDRLKSLTTIAYIIGLELYPVTKYTCKTNTSHPEHFILLSDSVCHPPTVNKDEERITVTNTTWLYRLFSFFK